MSDLFNGSSAVISDCGMYRYRLRDELTRLFDYAIRLQWITDNPASHAELCDRCGGLGTADCHCGGDLCVCENYGEMECPRCHGEGYFVPTAAYKAEREQMAKWWREYQERIANQKPNP